MVHYHDSVTRKTKRAASCSGCTGRNERWCGSHNNAVRSTMSSNQTIRIHRILGVLAVGAVSATVFAQTTPAPDSVGVPQGYTQVQPPKDPLVERRENRKEAADEYKANKKAARKDYKQDKKAARQERKAADKDADTAAKQLLSAPKQ